MIIIAGPIASTYVGKIFLISLAAHHGLIPRNQG
jgi:hypothetical protein